MSERHCLGCRGPGQGLDLGQLLDRRRGLGDLEQLLERRRGLGQGARTSASCSSGAWGSAGRSRTSAIC